MTGVACGGAGTDRLAHVHALVIPRTPTHLQPTSQMVKADDLSFDSQSDDSSLVTKEARYMAYVCIRRVLLVYGQSTTLLDHIPPFTHSDDINFCAEVRADPMFAWHYWRYNYWIPGMGFFTEVCALCGSLLAVCLPLHPLHLFTGLHSVFQRQSQIAVQKGMQLCA